MALLTISLIGGAAAAFLLVFEAKSINQSGGWGWLLIGGIYVVAIAVVGFACALCTAVSLFRRESHRRLSIAILILSCLVVAVLGPPVIGVVNRLRRQHGAAARTRERTPRGAVESPSPATIPPAPDKGLSASVIADVANPQILELKSKISEAVRTQNAVAFVDCFYIEDRFNTPDVREENRQQIEILLRGKTIEVVILEIPPRDLIDIMKIQNAKPASTVRYSLVPRMMLQIRQETPYGSSGRSFLIGEKNGKWYIITLAGHLT